MPGSGAPGACRAFANGTTPLDASRGIDKQFRLAGDRWSATLRIEFFNIFNHTQFSNPVDPVPAASPLLRRATSTFDPRVGQLSLRIAF